MGDFLTTGEAARLLGFLPSEVLPILRAFAIRHKRLGRTGAFLWDRAAVEGLRSEMEKAKAAKPAELAPTG